MYSTAKSRQDKSAQNIYPINLVNSAGDIVQSWNAGCPIFSAIVYKKFQVAVLCFADLDLVLPGGTGGLFKLIDADSNLVFQYENILIHHTFERKNENFFFLQNRALSQVEKKKYRLTYAGKNIWSERLIEVNRKGETLWTWDFIDDGSLDIHARIDTGLPELTHANSVKFYSSNIFSKNPALLVSFRNLSTIALIDYVTKKILWLSPKNAFDYQHDATLIDDKSVLAFNNGIHDEFMNTKILIINLQNNMVKNIFSHTYFSVPKQGGVQMLANGHFLITNSMEGYGFEINADTKKEFSILNLANPSMSLKDSWINRSPIFKINRYSFSELQDKN